VADRPLRPATHRGLGELLPHQLANGPRAPPDAEAEAAFARPDLWPGGTSGISPSFLGLSRSSGQVTHVLLTRSRLCPRASPGSSLHLHVLGTPPAFVLSQDQTLRESDSRVSSAVPGQGEAAPLSSLESCHASVCAAEYTDRRRHDRVVCPSPARRRPEGRRGTEVPVRPATGRTCRGHGPTGPRLARCSVFKDRIRRGRRDAPPTHEPPRRRPPSIAANGGPLQARDRWGAAV
jgi:hypothetical protein